MDSSAASRSLTRRQAILSSLALAGLAIAIAASVASDAGADVAPEPSAKLLASEKVAPKRVSFEGAGVGRLALTRKAYRRTWQKFRLSGRRPAVNLNRRAVLFAYSGESGSCPMNYRGLSLNRPRGVLRIEIEEIDGICTSDWTPRTMVISLPRTKVPKGKLYTRYDSQGLFRVRRVRK